MKNIFVVILRYLVDIAEIDTNRPNHLKFLDAQYEKGNFIVSGRQVPRTGGIIIARMESREALENVLKEDPYAIHHLAEYQIFEFAPGHYASEFKAILEMK